VNRVVAFVAGFVRFWYDFIIGDDWSMAAAVAIGLAVSAVLTRRGLSAWWVIPPVVIVALYLSLWRASRARARRHR
jgi:hypothetical protein